MSKSYCNNCGKKTNQKVLQEEVNAIHDDSGWSEEHIYQIIRCGGCDEISFRKLYTDIQIQSNALPGESILEEIYPKHGENTIIIKKFKKVPQQIKEIYRETIEAFNNVQLILCSGGLRAIIEGICLEKSIEGITKQNKKGENYLSTNLPSKIEGLLEKGYLTKTNSDCLLELRFLGNDAMHELKKPGLDELKLAIEIIESTLENIYELHHKAKTIKIKKEERLGVK